MSLCSLQQAARVQGIWRGTLLSPPLKFGLRAKKDDVCTLSFTLTPQLTDTQESTPRMSRTTSPTACTTRHMIQEEFLECLTLNFKAIRSFDTTRIIYLTTQRDVLEPNGQQYLCESLKYHIVLTSAAALTKITYI